MVLSILSATPVLAPISLAAIPAAPPAWQVMDTGTNVCVLCNLKCTACAETATNCSSCTPSGTDAAYLYGTTCIVSCPATTIGNNATRICDGCPSNCNTCTSTTVCTVCTSPYGLHTSLCYNPCPAASYYSSGVCVSCDPKCLACTSSPTTCSVCSNTAPNVAYLSGTSCLTSCLTGTYPSTNPN